MSLNRLFVPVMVVVTMAQAAAPAAAASQDLAASSGSAASSGPTPQETASRRDRLVAELRKELSAGERGLFYLTGGSPKGLEETRQTPSFYYLTGVDLPGAALVLGFDDRTMWERLYLKSRDSVESRWSGMGLGPGGVDPNTQGPDEVKRRTMEATGFSGESRKMPSTVSDAARLRDDLSVQLGSAGALFLVYEPPGLDDPPTAESALVSDIRARYPQIRILKAGPALTRLRLVKSPAEIESIRRAVEITCEAQKEAMRAIRPGINEYEIEGLVEYVFTRSGARFQAFPTIVGSGPNACVIHYNRNDRTIKESDLVVIDAGAEFGHYAADVTRTMPASGRFSAEQLKVYRAVLRAQSETKSLVKPGATIRELHEKAASVLGEEGLREKFLHGCCHFVGLDVHDVGDRSVALAPGMVLTVEPGAYIPEKEIGVRIEDTFLVTENGYEQLSACVPSDPVEVEKEMARRR